MESEQQAIAYHERKLEGALSLVAMRYNLSVQELVNILENLEVSNGE